MGSLGQIVSWIVGPLRSPELISYLLLLLLLLLRLWVCNRTSVVRAQRHVHSRVEESTADAVALRCHRRAAPPANVMCSNRGMPVVIRTEGPPVQRDDGPKLGPVSVL